MDVQGNAVEDGDFVPSNYCRHGRFVGSPLGGDYLCQLCEDGVSDREFALMGLESRLREAGKTAAYQLFPALSGLYPNGPVPVALACSILRGLQGLPPVKVRTR